MQEAWLSTILLEVEEIYGALSRSPFLLMLAWKSRPWKLQHWSGVPPKHNIT